MVFKNGSVLIFAVTDPKYCAIASHTSEYDCTRLFIEAKMSLIYEKMS